MATNEKEKSLNRGWLKAILEMLGDQTGGNRVIFPCDRGTRSIMAGRGVPLAAMNAGVNQVGNAMLSTTNLWYNPTAEMKYNDALKMYFDYVVFPDAPKAAQDLVDSKQALLETRQKKYSELNKAARAEWKADPDLSRIPYETYLNDEHPDVVVAKSEMRKAVQAVTDAQLATNIPGAEKLKLAKERLSKIENGIKEAGVTMPAVIGYQNLDVAEYVPKVINGTNTTVPEPSEDIVYVASYSIDQGYRAQMDTWYKNFDPQKPGSEKFEITETQSSDEKLSQSGHSSEAVETSVGWGGFIRYTKDNTTDWSKSESTSHKGSIKITAEIQDKKIFTVTPSTVWDVPGYKKQFPYVGDKCPETVKNLVQPSAMLCASGVRLTVTLSDEVATKFDEEFKEVKQRQGYISVFGFSFPVGRDPDVNTKSTHTGTWNATSKTLTIEPTRDEGCAVLLAMIGRKAD